MNAKEQITKTLEDAGLGDRIGKRFGTSGHNCGLPNQTWVSVRPNYSPIDGAHVVLVTTEHVASYVNNYPSNFSDWRLRTRQGYSTPAEMVKAVQQMVKQPQGCWA